MKIYGLLIGRLTIAGISCIAATLAPNADAQSFPSRAITIIVPNPAGSAMEGTFRSISTEATRLLGQPTIIENRAGANGRLGISAIKTAPGDGYLLTIASDSVLVSQPSADPGFQVEEGKDYLPVAFLIEFPLVLAGRMSLPFRDIRGLLQYAKANPGKINWATSPGTLFMTERLRQTAGIEITTVPYKGASPSFIDVVAGRIDVVIAGPDVASFFDAGKMVGIATTGGERWNVFPGLPTLTEAGLPVASTVWYGLLASPRTPPDVVAKLNTAFNSALKLPHITKLIDGNGFTTGRYSSPKEFSAFIQSETAVWRPIIRKSGIKLD